MAALHRPVEEVGQVLKTNELRETHRQAAATRALVLARSAAMAAKIGVFGGPNKDAFRTIIRKGIDGASPAVLTTLASRRSCGMKTITRFSGTEQTSVTRVGVRPLHRPRLAITRNIDGFQGPSGDFHRAPSLAP